MKLDRKSMWIIVVLLIFLLLGACDFPSATPTITYVDLMPICSGVGLEEPDPVFPGHYVIVTDLMPTFAWTYPGDCIPEGYEIQVTTYGGYGYGTTITDTVGGGATSWSPPSPLEPATDYEWHVAAIGGSTVGPYSHSNRFWTGPLCDPGSLLAPEQIGPADGSVVTNSYPPLHWSYPDPCVPEDFIVELSSDAGFAGPNLMDNSLPAPATAQIPAVELMDCTDYFWRVTAVIGVISGPSSPTWSFTTDFSNVCAPVDTPEPTPTPTPESVAPMVKALMNANCRFGPGTVYDVNGHLLEGETAPVEARNFENTWWWIRLPERNINCWIADMTVESNFEPDDLPIRAAPPTPTPQLGGISGMVWDDECTPPWHTPGTPPPPPDGCLGDGSGGYWANGVIDPGETGIANVLVRLGSGSCPSTGLASATTNANGVYSFSGLTPGSYCVSISVSENINSLVPGGWSYPPSPGGDLISTNVTVNPGATTTGINFGWDFQF